MSLYHHHQNARFEAALAALAKTGKLLSRSARAVGRFAIRLMIFHGRADCFPSHRTIAEKCDCSVSTVKRALAELKAAGVLEWQRRWAWVPTLGCRRYTSNIYAVTATFLGSLILSQPTHVPSKNRKRKALSWKLGVVKTLSGQPEDEWETAVRQRLAAKWAADR